MSSSSAALSLHQLRLRHASSRRHSSLPYPLFFTIPGRRPPHRIPLPPGALPRRLFLPSASFIWDAITGGSSSLEASSAVRRGMLLFRQVHLFSSSSSFSEVFLVVLSYCSRAMEISNDVGTGGKGDVGGSLAEFDRAIELDPRQKSYLWQRGLSLYYLNRFKEGAEQFRTDVAENPNDTEESIWCFLCEAQLYGAEEARGRFLQVGRDPRPFMREAYNMFKDGGDPEKLVSMFSDGQGIELFYASLYAGLYYESQNDADSSKRHILGACASEYGVSSGDYMTSLARVHRLCRNWMPGK